MTYHDLGYTDALENHRKDQNLEGFEKGRVIAEHKDRYTIKTPTEEYDAELIGNLRFTAESRLDLPAVGDWVAFSEFDVGKALIHATFPRTSILERQAVGTKGQIQVIATNIDFGLLVQAVDRDFNPNRLERYLTICNAAKVAPIIVLSKTDLITQEELDEIDQLLAKRLPGIPLVKTSMQKSDGFAELKSLMQKGKTYCLLGSSGVGKSTLLNGISGTQTMETGAISSSVNKGRHITSHRELVVMPNGGILIDNPGMREVGITDAGSGLETTFDAIIRYSQDCRYANCTHMHEEGCAVIQAVEEGLIDEGAYNNYRKMEKEKMHFESDAQERKKKDKDFGKMVKNVKKQRKNNKF